MLIWCRRAYVFGYHSNRGGAGHLQFSCETYLTGDQYSFTVGGGIRTIRDVGVMLEAGADKISINSMAVKDPSVIDQMANEFGSQCIVCAIDVKKTLKGNWEVYIAGGRVRPLWTPSPGRRRWRHGCRGDPPHQHGR